MKCMRLDDEETKEGLNCEQFLLMILKGTPLSTVKTPPLRDQLFENNAACDYFHFLDQEIKLLPEISRVSFLFPGWK